jgi:hypothetical protein
LIGAGRAGSGFRGKPPKSRFAVKRWRASFFIPLAVTIGAAALGNAGVARAAGRLRVAVSHATFTGDVTPEARQILTQRLAEGLTKADLDLREAEPREQSPCQSPACYRELADRWGVGFLIAATVSEHQKIYDIQLEIINGSNGRESGSHQQRCQICGITEAGERMSLAASALTTRLRDLTKQPGRIVFRTNPAGAKIAINGEVRGATPVEVTLPAGRHQVRLEAQGYRPLEQGFTVSSGVDHSVELALLQIPSRFPHKTAGWIAVGAGVALIAGGVYAMSLHGVDSPCADEKKDPSGNCPMLYEADLIGAGLIGLGAISATIGGVWIYLGSQPGASGGETASGVSAGYRGRF